MLILVNFIILIIIRKFLKVISVMLFGELYMLYFSYEIFILNSLNKMKDKIKT